MKLKFISTIFIVLLTYTEAGYSGTYTIPKSYTTGDTLTASDLNTENTAIKTAIDDNNAEIINLHAADGQVSNKVFNSTINYQIPVLTTTAGNTTVNVLISNQSSTSCYAYLGASYTLWNIGSNTFGFLIPLILYSQTYMTGRTSSGTFPNITNTYTLVARSNLNTDISAEDYVDLTLHRNESSSSDSCNAGDIYVRGAIVTYPTGMKSFVPVKDMVVN